MPLTLLLVLNEEASCHSLRAARSPSDSRPCDFASLGGQCNSSISSLKLRDDWPSGNTGLPPSVSLGKAQHPKLESRNPAAFAKRAINGRVSLRLHSRLLPPLPISSHALVFGSRNASVAGFLRFLGHSWVVMRHGAKYCCDGLGVGFDICSQCRAMELACR